MIYLKIFWTFFKIGLFTFGGGYAMLPLIQQEVTANSWLSEEELIDFIAISESTPGPLAVNVSTFVGMQTAGFLGAAFATMGVVLPSFVIILIVARVYDRFQKSKVVNGAMIGLKGAVVGLIGSAIMMAVVPVFGNALQAMDVKEIAVSLLLIAGLALGLKKKINPIILIVASAIVGIIIKPFI